MRGVLALGLVACSEPPIEIGVPPCDSSALVLQAAPARGAFGDLTDGRLWCGIPPQGGAPYSPLRIRLLGGSDWSAGAHLELIASDLDDGSELAYTELDMGLVCANVGDNEGFWVGSEAHMRYDGLGLDDLDGRLARLTVRASTLDGLEQTEASWQVDLSLDQP